MILKLFARITRFPVGLFTYMSIYFLVKTNIVMVIAVDFDGTCVTHDFPRVGTDIGAIPVLKALVEKGHQLILYTMRDDEHVFYRGELLHPKSHLSTIPSVLQDAVNWFKDNNIKLFGVNNNPDQHSWNSSNKIYAEIYIDDSALGVPLKTDLKISNRPFVDWFSVERILKSKGIL